MRFIRDQTSYTAVLLEKHLFGRKAYFEVLNWEGLMANLIKGKEGYLPLRETLLQKISFIIEEACECR